MVSLYSCWRNMPLIIWVLCIRLWWVVFQIILMENKKCTLIYATTRLNFKSIFNSWKSLSVPLSVLVCIDYSAFKLEPVCIVFNVWFVDNFFKFMLNICILTKQHFNKDTMYVLPLFLNTKDGRIKYSLTTNVLALF